MLRFARQKCHRVEFLRQVSVRRATSDGASPVIDVNVHSTDIYWGGNICDSRHCCRGQSRGTRFLGRY